jgi:AcrR family transcriptional regulator
VLEPSCAPSQGFLHKLSPGARSLLEAAKRLLREKGFDSLRLEAIAREAGENKAMIRYYFGDKAGLIGAVVDDLTHESTVSMLSRSQSLPNDEARIHAHLEGIQAMMKEPQFRSLFDVLPHAFRDEELRLRLADLYDWYREVNLLCLRPEVAPEQMERAQTLASLVMAAVDGLAIQAALQPDTFNSELSFRMLEEVVKHVLSTSTEDS